MLSDTRMFTVVVLGLVMQRPMTTEELYQHVQFICPTHCPDSVHNNWEVAWRHKMRSAQNHLRQKKLIKQDKTTGAWQKV